MTVEVTPEPTDAERAAILDALERTQAEDARLDPWWWAGVREAASAGTDAEAPG